MIEPVEPRLERLMRVSATLGEILTIGQVTAGRVQRTVPIAGGTFQGEGALRGQIVPGGADWQEVLDDGTTLIDTRYTLRADSGGLIDVRTRGSRTGPEEVLRALTEVPDVDPASYAFRLSVSLATADPQLAWLNHLVVVASAVRAPDAVVYDAFVLR